MHPPDADLTCFNNTLTELLSSTKGEEQMEVTFFFQLINLQMFYQNHFEKAHLSTNHTNRGAITSTIKYYK